MSTPNTPNIRRYYYKTINQRLWMLTSTQKDEFTKIESKETNPHQRVGSIDFEQLETIYNKVIGEK